uniref:Uncharacterized protein n=1 Tax=Pyramimonas obovata TaxID=1411642 RepID=A0A7S0WSA1_9CHLO|mmetsp:Transcript_37363/g.81382  ORF Transcript_37363/g.81382 Transcript_37363/m.81382 type:complete len:253 (+) Transcript_37363:96-854(+)
MPYGGYSGFELEAVRQTSLKGRKFREEDKCARLVYFHQNNIRNDNIPVTPLVPPSFTLAPIAAQGRRRGPAVEVTHESTYNPLTGEPSVKPPPPCLQLPHIDHFPLLSTSAHQAGSPLGKSSPHRDADLSPTKRRARGAKPDVEYSSVSRAMRPLDLQKELLKPSALEHKSFGELRNEKSHHSRSMFGPQDRYVAPVTSSQLIGWRTSQQGVQTGPHSKYYFGNRLCKETRLAQSLIIGPRGSGGYAGQGCL